MTTFNNSQVFLFNMIAEKYENLATKRLVEMAIKLENDAYRAFLYYSEKVSEKDLQKVLQKIAMNEKMHITMVKDLFRKRFRKDKWSLEDDYFHPFLDLNAHIEDDMKIINNAIDFEIKAMKFYEILETRLAGIFREIVTYLRFFKEKHYFLLSLEKRKLEQKQKDSLS